VSNRDTDSPAPETPDPIWPPAPRVSPPRRPLIPPGNPPRTWTPFVWLDALLGLPAGFVLYFLVGFVVETLEPQPTDGTQQVTEGYAGLAIIAVACAAVCFVIGRRFPVLAALTALGVLGMIVCTIWWLSQHGYL